MSANIQAVRGMNDILPEEAVRWECLEELLRTWLRSYGYRNIRTPLLEQTVLFRRAIGEVTDIVEKEMYSFVDELNGEHLTLRPEATASTVRAGIEHSLTYGAPQRLYYFGPMFRHERPQKGRYRQFHQVGAEALGLAGPDVDAEMIIMCARLWDDLGLSGHLKLHINSLGDSRERAAHREALVKYLELNVDSLDSDARRRMHSNPLRVLDSKNPEMQALIETAPRLTDFLGDASLAHFNGVQNVLKDAGIPYLVDPRLVRGLDYYNLTVFEWVTDKLGTQGAVCGGGRYDGLFAQLGGKSTAACGWAMGLERLVALLDETGWESDKSVPDVYLVNLGEGGSRFAFRVAEYLRDRGLNVTQHFGGGSFKAQFRRADASGAPVAVVVGDDEARDGEAVVKPMRESRGQVRVALDRLGDAVAEHLFQQNSQMTESTP